MDNKITTQDIEDVFNDIAIKDKGRRSFNFYTNENGMNQFHKQLEINIYEEYLKAFSTKFNNEQKNNLILLLNSDLEEDFTLAKNIINTKIK